MPDDGMKNWFDQVAAVPPTSSEEPPLPSGEDDYGENVVILKPNKRREGWKSEWQVSENGSPLPNLRNVMLTLRHHPKLSGLVRYDEMARVPILCEQIPGTTPDPKIPRQIRDADIIAIQEEIQITGLRRVAKATIQDAVEARAQEERYHPVKDYLESLTWDGVSRVDRWLSYYLGAEPDQGLDDKAKENKRKYISRIGRLFLIALIARIYKPGCKADYMLILEGPQGEGKSSACRALAGEWFSDNLPDLSRGDSVRLSMHLRGKWLIEIAEMSSFSNAESHKLKEFLTQTEERYTPKFGRNEVSEPRQCLFIGSTNEGTYLRDSTGGRRFWPVAVGKLDLDALKTDRDQLFAEAVQLFKNDEPWWPDRDFEAEYIAPEQALRHEEDGWQEAIEAWISTDNVRSCTVTEVLRSAIGLTTEKFGTREQRRVSAILLGLGWKRNEKNSRRPFECPKREV